MSRVLDNSALAGPSVRQSDRTEISALRHFERAALRYAAGVSEHPFPAPRKTSRKTSRKTTETDSSIAAREARQFAAGGTPSFKPVSRSASSIEQPGDHRETDNNHGVSLLHHRPVTKPLESNNRIPAHNATVHDRNPLIDNQSVMSTLPEQIAACRSLAKTGLTRVPLKDIKRYSAATERWVCCLEHFLDNPDTRLFFPDGIPSTDCIAKLAIFHDKPVRPPQRFIYYANTVHVSRRAPKVYRHALAEHRRISQDLSTFMDWIDVEAMPISDEGLELLDCLLNDNTANRLSLQRRRAMAWYEPLIHSPYRFSTQLANGNLASLREVLQEAVRFKDHIHFNRSLGPDFNGIDTPWKPLHAAIEFCQSIRDVVLSAPVAAQLVQHWSRDGSRFYSHARKASVLNRRMVKLNKLVLRPGSGSISSRKAGKGPNNPYNYLEQAKFACNRLSLWCTVVTRGRNNAELTPADVLQSLKPKVMTRINQNQEPGFSRPDGPQDRS